MSLIRLNKTPSRRELALFGLLWLIFFAIGGIVLFRRDAPLILAVAAWAAAVLVPAVGWLVPAWMRIVYLGMSLVTFPIGLVVSYLLMAAIYYLLLTPVGLLMRMAGRDPMNRQFDARADSYWTAREADEGIDRYFRQW